MVLCMITNNCVLHKSFMASQENFVPSKILDAVSPFHTSFLQNLVEYCVKYIAGHMKLVVRSQGFRELDPVVLQKLMTLLAPYDVFKT